MTVLHEIESAMGRQRPPVRWASRRIDLDLLHYEGVSLQTARLMLPHPEMPRRSFVLVPLAEIAPQLELPGMGPVRELVRQMGSAGLRLWSES